jgi:archaellum component FlaC
VEAISKELNPMEDHLSDESEFRKINEIKSQDSDLLSIDDASDTVKIPNLSAITIPEQAQKKNPLLDS